MSRLLSWQAPLFTTFTNRVRLPSLPRKEWNLDYPYYSLDDLFLVAKAKSIGGIYYFRRGCRTLKLGPTLSEFQPTLRCIYRGVGRPNLRGV